MFSTVIEFLELWSLDNVIVIDGVAYAPFEPLAYALQEAILRDFIYHALFVFVCAVVVRTVFLLLKFLVLKLKKNSPAPAVEK